MSAFKTLFLTLLIFFFQITNWFRKIYQWMHVTNSFWDLFLLKSSSTTVSSPYLWYQHPVVRRMSSKLFQNWRKLLLFQRKLDGYNFPVYSTKQCPKNNIEWNQRFSAINCTEKNGYMCLPNENITGLLEFCHTNKFILIQEGK